MLILLQDFASGYSTSPHAKVFKSDNGPPLFSEEIKDYTRENGINHQKITLRLQANAEAENFMKPFIIAITSAHAEGRNWTNFYVNTF